MEQSTDPWLILIEKEELSYTTQDRSYMYIHNQRIRKREGRESKNFLINKKRESEREREIEGHRERDK